MKLEVGMFIRFKDGTIDKLIEVQKKVNYYILKYSNKSVLSSNGQDSDIIKASHNIIDLIEVGDILHDNNDNEYWTVQRVEKDELENISIQTEWEGLESEEEFLDYIDEIITKEQAKNISYKIGE